MRTQEFVQLNCYVTSTGTLSIFFSSIITVVSRTLGILLTLLLPQGFLAPEGQKPEEAP